MRYFQISPNNCAPPSISFRKQSIQSNKAILVFAKYTLCSSARDSIYCVDRKGKYNINITLRDRVLARAQNSDRAWSDDGDATAVS